MYGKNDTIPFDVTMTIYDEMVADLEPTPYDEIDEMGDAATITKRVRAGPQMVSQRTNWLFTQKHAIKERKACERRRGRARDLALRQKSSLHRPEWVGDNYYGSYIGYKGRVEEERGPGWEPIYDLTLEGLELVGYRKVPDVDLPLDSEWERQKNEAAAMVFDEDDDIPSEIEILTRDVHSALLSGRVYGWYARAKELVTHNVHYYLSDRIYNFRHEKAHPCHMPRWPARSE